MQGKKPIATMKRIATMKKPIATMKKAHSYAMATMKKPIATTKKAHSYDERAHSYTMKKPI